MTVTIEDSIVEICQDAVLFPHGTPDCTAVPADINHHVSLCGEFPGVSNHFVCLPFPTLSGQPIYKPFFWPPFFARIFQ